MAAWGAFQARRVTNPCARLGQPEKGVSQQGTRSPNFPTRCCPRVPMSAPMATACREPAAGIPVPPARKPGGRLVLSSQSIFAFLPGWSFTTSQSGNSVLRTGKKDAGPAARHHGDAAECQH